MSNDDSSPADRGSGFSAGLGAWGRDDLMAIAAVRYCLGRMTYITSDCSEWLLQQWPNIKPNARAVIHAPKAVMETSNGATSCGSVLTDVGSFVVLFT